jgi:YVTN family beta-propeller protein
MGSAMKKMGVLAASTLVCAAALVMVAPAAGTAPVSGTTYNSNSDSDSVSVIDTATNTVVETIEVGSNPRNLGISPNGERVYVPNRDGDSVSVIDTNTNAVLTTVEGDDASDPGVSFIEPYAIAVTPDNSQAWVANKEDSDTGDETSVGFVTIIDAASNTVVDFVTDPCFQSPEGIALNPVSPVAYVVNRQGDTVCVIDRNTLTVTDTVPVGDDPRYAVVTPDGASVYVSNNGGDVTKINASDLTTETIDVDGSPRNMVMSPDGSKVFVAPQSNYIVVINTADDSFFNIDVPDASSLYGVAYDPFLKALYATDENNGVVWVIPEEDQVETAEITSITVADKPGAIVAFVPPPPEPEPTPELEPNFTG